MAEEWRINMQSLIDELKDEYGYSSYDIAMVKYVLTSIFYEFSKLIIFGIFFGFLGYFESFLVSLILLLFLRINIGGIHCKHYITCFLLTFVVLFSSIILLPKLLFVAPILIISICTICMIINYKIGPIASPFRPSPDSILIKKCQNTGFVIIFIFIIFVSFFHEFSLFATYFQVGFWTIVLHTAQLFIAKISKKEECANA